MSKSKKFSKLFDSLVLIRCPSFDNSSPDASTLEEFEQSLFSQSKFRKHVIQWLITKCYQNNNENQLNFDETIDFLKYTKFLGINANEEIIEGRCKEDKNYDFFNQLTNLATISINSTQNSLTSFNLIQNNIKNEFLCGLKLLSKLCDNKDAAFYKKVHLIPESLLIDNKIIVEDLDNNNLNLKIEEIRTEISEKNSEIENIKSQFPTFISDNFHELVTSLEKLLIECNNTITTFNHHYEKEIQLWTHISTPSTSNCGPISSKMVKMQNSLNNLLNSIKDINYCFKECEKLNIQLSKLENDELQEKNIFQINQDIKILKKSKI